MASIETIPALRRYIATQLAAGVSMRVALAAYRGAGGAIRTDDFATIWRDEERKAGKDTPDAA